MSPPVQAVSNCYHVSQRELTGACPECQVEQVANQAVGPNSILQNPQEFEWDDATDPASVNTQYSHAGRGRL